ncbi:hypothetical protein, partial [Kingella oralis]|uniref:hypothetical protein n=1 Tax=Kingella oralis TaxID=505 RepID=UPI0034E4551A
MENIVFRLPFACLLPAQAFRRLPRAGVSPCTPRSINHSLPDFRLPYRATRRPLTHPPHLCY